MTENQIDSVISPVYILHQYAWAVLQANDSAGTVWRTSNYGGKVPIVPLNEEPELVEYGGPRIVYDYSLQPTGNPYAGRGQMTFAVMDTSYRRLNDTLTVLVETFDRQDETARDINDWSSLKSFFVGIRFGELSLAFSDGGAPRESEGGEMVGIVSINFVYFADYSINTRPGLNP